MRCEDVREQSADYVAGALTGPVEAEVETHLHECSACATEVEELRETWRLLGTVPSDRADSAAMRARLDAALAGYEHGLRDTRKTANPLRALVAGWWPFQSGVPRLGYATLALVTPAILVLGVVIGRETAPVPTSDPELATLREELSQVRQMMTLSLLQQTSASERLRGVSWSSQLEMPGSEVVTALLDALKHDQNVNVRLASIDALRRFAHEEPVRRACLDALPQQSSPLVQIALIDFMVEVEARESVGALRRLSQDPMLNEAVRARATSGLQRLGAA